MANNAELAPAWSGGSMESATCITRSSKDDTPSSLWTSSFADRESVDELQNITAEKALLANGKEDKPAPTDNLTTPHRTGFIMAFVRNLSKQKKNDSPSLPPSSDENTFLIQTLTQNDTSSLAARWNFFTRQYSIWILAVTFLILWPLGLYSLPRFTKSTDSSFRPVSGSLSDRAVTLFRNAYGNKDGGLNADDPLNPGVIVLLDQVLDTRHDNGTAESMTTLVDGKSTLYNAARNFSLSYEAYLNDHLLQLCGNNNHQSTGCICNASSSVWTRMLETGDCQGSTNDSPTKISVVSYYSMKERHLPTLAQPFATPSGHSTFLYITYSIPASINAHYNIKKQYISSILDTIQIYGTNNIPPNVKIGYTGLRYFQRDLVSGVHNDLRLMDMLILPLSLSILCIVLGCNFYLMIVPIVTITSTVCAWSVVMYPVAKNMMQIAQFTPSVMMSLSLGLGIDYTLFLLSRVLSEIRCRALPQDETVGDVRDLEEAFKYEAIGSMIQHAGYTIVVSGVTLMCTFLGLTLLPLQALKSVGAGASVCIGVCIAINLTVVPALLHTKMVGKLLLRQRRGGSPCYNLMAVSLGKLRTYMQTGIEGLTQNSKLRWRRCHCRSAVDLPKAAREDSSLSGDQEYTFFNEVLDLVSPQRKVVNLSDEPLLLSSDGCDLNNNSDTSLSPVSRSNSFEAGTSFQNVNPFDALRDSVSVSSRNGGGSEILPGSLLFFRLSRHLLRGRSSACILVVILAVILPMSWQSKHLKSSIAFEMMLPTASPALKTFHQLGEEFGLGALSPYRLVFDGNAKDEPVDSVEAFEVMQTVVMALIDAQKGKKETGANGLMYDASLIDNLAISQQSRHLSAGNYSSTLEEPDSRSTTEVKLSSFAGERQLGHMFSNDTKPVFPLLSNFAMQRDSYTGIAWANGGPIPHPVFLLAKLCAKVPPSCPVEPLHALSEIDNHVTAANRRTTFLTTTLDVSPFSKEGVNWLLSVRKTLSMLEMDGKLKNFTVVLEGGAGVEYDAVQKVYDTFPLMITLTLGTVFVLMGLFFRSIVTPLRSVFSICLTTGFVYGLMVLVFQDGICNWTNVQSLQGSLDGEVSWLAPIMAFSIIVGLGLDYDVFLISRILEFRLEGYTHRSSILAGLHETGGIITSAGVIMAVAFGGLMLSTSPVLYQWSFLLTSAVLMDTFVIRTIVVPILMNFTGRYSWWPRKLPPRRVDLFRHFMGWAESVSSCAEESDAESNRF